MSGGPELEAVVSAAVAARPTLDRAAFARHLAALAPPSADLAAADLALAFQASQGDTAAIVEVHALVERAARPALAGAGYVPTLVDDAVQETSILLLVGRDGVNRPTLLTYQGRAGLAAWITTIALRTAARLSKVGAGAVDESVLERLAGAHDPAAAVLKAELRPTVHAAFIAAIGDLSYFDRELLADVILHGQTIDQLARKHDVHRATAARWVGRARATLDEKIRGRLGASLALDSSEISSVLGAVATNLELTPVRLEEPVLGTRR